MVRKIVVPVAFLASVCCAALAKGDVVYRVQADGRDVPLHSVNVAFGPGESKGDVSFAGKYSFGWFELTNSVEVRVTCSQPLDRVKILPESAGIVPRNESPNTISFKASGPFKVSLERDGRRAPLLLFADAPECGAPAADADGTVYFGPGVHDAGLISLSSGQTLYLAAGAVVNGCVKASGDGITICGRGLLTGSAYPRFKGPGRYLLDLEKCCDLTVRDVMMSGSFAWTLVLSDCERVLVDNVKIVNSNMINDDALDICNSRNVTVRRSFFRAQDDIIAVKGNGKNRAAPATRDIFVEDCTFWTDCANAFRLGYECDTAEMRNIKARNIDIIHCSKVYRPPERYWSNAVFWLQPSAGMTLSDCLFEDIRVRSDDCDMILVQAEPRVCTGADGVRYPCAGRLRNCVFRNVSVSSGSVAGGVCGCDVVVKGRSASEDVDGILFEGVTRFGTAMAANAPRVTVGPFARNIRFVPAQGTTPVVSVIPLLSGEVWWGGGGGDGQSQPYGTKVSRRIDLRRHGDTSSPLLVSSRGRYIWSERPFGYVFKDGKLILDSDVEKIEPVNAGSTLKEAYLAAAKAHMRFDGRTPPDIFFTLPQWNNWIEIALRGMNQKSVDDYTAELASSGFPCGVYMMDGGWLSYQGSYRFDTDNFPDPKGMLKRINDQGWVSLIWTAHFVSPDSREYKRLRWLPPGANGLDYLAYRKKPFSREAAAIRWWSGISAIYDLTKPEARDYYVKKLKDFAAEYGVHGFKFDAGDPVFLIEDCRFHDETAEPVDYARLYAELAADEFPYNEIRVSWKCGGLPIVSRLNDRAHAWTGDRAQDTVVPQVITAGLLGCPYLVADMVGGGLESSFNGRKIDEKLFVRSCAMQALMPMMQFSPAPWRHLSAEGVKACRDFADLHIKFAPYIMELVRHAAKTGEPIVRAMEYEYPHQGFNRSMCQFMLGERWLIAPVTTQDDAVTVELPAGEWRDDLGETHIGPKSLCLSQVPVSRLPRFERLSAPTP